MSTPREFALWVLDDCIPAKKENTKKTCGLSYGALQNPSFKEKVE